MRPSLVIRALVAMASALAAAAVASAQSGGDFALRWSSLDAGRLATSLGGSYSLDGMAGQAEAAAPAAGGTFALTGGFLVFAGSGTTAVPGPSAPLSFAVPPLSPNPFRVSTVLALSLPHRAPVRVEVFDVGGKRVRTLRSGELPAARHRVAWDGRDDRGAAVPDGIYFVRVNAGSLVATRRVARIH